MLTIISRLQVLHAVLSNRRGAAMVEYALLAALIAVVVATAATTLGTTTSSKFATITSKL